MLRRHFLATATIAAAIPAKSILTHEHVLVDFIGADAIRPGRYDPDEVFRLALPKLKELRALGCRRLLECTPNFLGRDPRLLRRLAKAANLEIWTNTGLYGAAEFKFLPAYARTETASQLAQRWIAEARNGVDGERVRFIKTGVNRGPLHPLDRKLVHAAIETAKATGLTMAVHTGDGRAALSALLVPAEGYDDQAVATAVDSVNKRLTVTERIRLLRLISLAPMAMCTSATSPNATAPRGLGSGSKPMRSGVAEKRGSARTRISASGPPSRSVPTVLPSTKRRAVAPTSPAGMPRSDATMRLMSMRSSGLPGLMLMRTSELPGIASSIFFWRVPSWSWPSRSGP